jgi:hypothetical protein
MSPTLSNLSEPVRSNSDGRHLFELRYLCIGAADSTENGSDLYVIAVTFWSFYFLDG